MDGRRFRVRLGVAIVGSVGGLLSAFAPPAAQAAPSPLDSLVINMTSTMAPAGGDNYRQSSWDASNAAVGANSLTSARISIGASGGQQKSSVYFDLAAAAGRRLQVGQYDIVGPGIISGPTNVPALNVIIDSTLETSSGRVNILDIAYGADDQVTRLDLTFQYKPFTPVYNVFGEIRLGESEPTGYTVSTRNLAWPLAPIGTPAVQATMWVHNTSAQHIHLGRAVVAGANPADFTLYQDGCSTLYVSAGKSCRIVVGFSPTAAGSRSATLTIPVDGTVASVALTGTAPAGFSRIIVSGPGYLVGSVSTYVDGPYFIGGGATATVAAFGAQQLYGDSSGFAITINTIGGPLRPGLFHTTTRGGTPTSFGFDASSPGHGCSDFAGDVNVAQVGYDSTGVLTNAYLTFVETCSDFPDTPLVGSVEWRLPAAGPLGSGLTTLTAGQWMQVGATLSTSTRRLVLQRDGNLVLYSAGGPVWNSRTNGSGDLAMLVLQGDGNLVLYSRAGRALWNSHTAGTGAHNVLTLQTDGNLVLRNAAGRALWLSNTPG